MSVMTKSGQVERILRRKILCGDWPPGTRLPAERDLLPKLNVSRTTLRDALNALSKEGLLNRRHRSGTFVSQTRVPTVAVMSQLKIFSSNVSFYYQHLVEAAKEQIQNRNYRFALSVGYGDTSEEFISSVHLLDKEVVDNIVGVLTVGCPGPVELRLDEARIPSVSIAPAVPGSQYSIVLDCDRMVGIGADLLHKAGYHDFSIMHSELYFDDPSTKPLNDKLDEIQSRVVDHDPARRIRVPWPLNDPNNYGKAYDVFKELWASPRRPRAILFFDDVLCDVTCRAILELGIKIPEELAIVTHGIRGKNFLLPTPLTQVEFDPDQVATAAWAMLRRLIAGELVEPKVAYISPVVREGTSL